ncbi:hypothetical protein [Streptomyces sp. MJP52]|uniref:hypothetical protein n=1 Tax=Streptomyces sp. MJP52 TaxID=2940555 RepID=UPI002472EA4C|nr:hypothetical protein [Streptomyces sp. MJP52]MDH6226788.1 hypothetical protein [Streptomyces sp. MJP52]
MWEPMVHVALKGDVVALCDAPIDAWTPRAEDPEQATCPECVGTYVEGWDAAQETPEGMEIPPGTPVTPAGQPWGGSRVVLLLLAAAVVLGLASAAVALLVGGIG